MTPQTSNEEAETEAQQHSGQDGAENGGLDNAEEVLREQLREDDNLDKGPESMQRQYVTLRGCIAIPYVVSVRTP